MTEYYFVNFYFCSRNSVNKKVFLELSMLLMVAFGPRIGHGDKGHGDDVVPVKQVHSKNQRSV